MSKNKTNLYKLSQKKLEEILLDGRYVEMPQLEAAVQKIGAAGKILEEVLITEKILDENKLLRILVNQLQIPYLSLQNYEIDPKLIEENKNLMVKYRYVPLYRAEKILTVLMATTMPMTSLEAMENETDQSDIFVFLGKYSEVMSTIDKYVPKDIQEAVNTQIIQQEAVQAPTAWFSVFDDADKAIRSELKQKATYITSPNEEESPLSEEEEFLGLEAEKQPSEVPQPEAPEPEQTQTPAPEEELSPQKIEMESLAAQLAQNPFDYEAVNRYVEIALEIGDLEAAIQQLVSFGKGLEQAGDIPGAVNCYQYILDLDPDNIAIKEVLDNLQKT